MTKGIAVALASFVLLGNASTAFASAQGDYTTPGVNIRLKTGTYSTVMGSGYPGQGLTAYCEVWDYKENSGDWFYHRNNTTGVKGYSIGKYLRVNGYVPHGC